MDSSAKVRSVDAIEQFKAALAEFGEVGLRALSEAESEIQRTIWWLKSEQSYYWRQQKKKRAEKLAQAKSELFRAQLSADQDNRSTTLERRGVERAEKALEEAEWKLQRIDHWVKLLEREMILYQGQTQQLSNALAADVPHAGAKLENMIRRLEEYIHLAPPTSDSAASATEAELESAAKPTTESDNLPKIRQLRDAAPRQSQRDSAAPTPLAELPDDRESAPLELSGFELPAPDAPLSRDAVVVEAGALSSKSIFLERSQSIVPGDSGWYLGAIGPSASIEMNPEIQLIQVRDLLERRPELASLLGLPRGYAAMIEGRRVRAVWTDRSRLCPRTEAMSNAGDDGRGEGQ